MADVGLVDVSLRDGNQSLWGAAGLRTAHVLQVAPLLERVGFRALDYSSRCARTGRIPGSCSGARGR
jgi:oxaloacetate decarboxylase (Na+ extruding) subunit alpha